MTGEPICNINIDSLPRQASHGEEVCDNYGNRWSYDSGQDGWISKGTITAPPLVTEKSNGIISPDIFDKLKKLESFIKSGYDLRPLKIYPGIDAYWYYFRSSDKMFRFKPEGNDTLRIEVDKARIFQLLLKETCPGPRGLKGDKGDKGKNGISIVDETCFTPSLVENDRIDFAIFTPTPLPDPNGLIKLPNNHVPEISVRLFPVNSLFRTTSQLQYLDVLYQSIGDRRTLDDFNKTRRLLHDRNIGIRIQSSICDIPMSPVAEVPEPSIAEEPILNVEISPTGDTQTVIYYNEDIPLDETRTLNSISYDEDTKIVCGSLFLLPGNNWASISSN